jgi:tetratricopeptide (TPR) repeat protein
LKALMLSICIVLGYAHVLSAQVSDALSQLAAGKVDMVERAFSTLQSNFEQGRATEFDLLDAYKVFYQREDSYSPQLDRWIKAYPKSSSAYLARGVYYRKLGEFRRGGQYISQVPPEDVKYMEQMHVLATRDLETSLLINPKSYLAVLHLLNIAQFEGDAAAATRYLNLGNKIFSSNFLIRARYLIQLTPKWGGSYNEMDRFIGQCKSQGVPQRTIDLFNAIKFDDQGRAAEEDGQIEKAHALSEKALVLSMSGDTRFRQDYLRHSARICSEPAYRAKPYCK